MKRQLSTAKLVMLIDDSVMDNFINNKILGLAGFSGEILVMDSAPEAIRYIKDMNDTAEQLPDIIFLDINMPGVDGYGFLEQYQKLLSSVSKQSEVVVLTSSDKEVDINTMKNFDVVKKYIVKPLTIDKLKSIL